MDTSEISELVTDRLAVSTVGEEGGGLGGEKVSSEVLSDWN